MYVYMVRMYVCMYMDDSRLVCMYVWYVCMYVCMTGRFGPSCHLHDLAQGGKEGRGRGRLSGPRHLYLQVSNVYLPTYLPTYLQCQTTLTHSSVRMYVCMYGM